MPLICGVALSSFPVFQRAGMFCMLSLAVASGVPVCCCLFNGRGPDRLFCMLSVVFFFSVGMLLSLHNAASVYTGWPGSPSRYLGVVEGMPRERTKSVLLPLRLTGGPSSQKAVSGQLVYLYVPKGRLSLSVQPGDTLSFDGAVTLPDNDAAGFDYAAYLLRNGVAGTSWADDKHWRIVSAANRVPARYRGLMLRKRMTESYMEWGLKGTVLAVVSAVSLGERDLLEQNIRDVYSSSGASHLLAVSGLHVGIIYACLSFVFPAFMNVSWRRWLKECMLIVLLWGYAFVVGFPFSVVRSLIMFTCVSAGRCCGREGAPLNSLALACSVILLCDPAALYDIGFQLSFLAVAAILLFQPLLAGMWKPRSTVAAYFWGIVTVSIAAQAGTAPVAAGVFSSFPIYFLLTNIVAIPLMFAVVSLVILMWSFAWMPPVRAVIVRLLSLAVTFLDRFLSGISSLPGSALTVRSYGWPQVTATYIILFLLYLYLSRRNSRYLVWATGILTCVLLAKLGF